MELLCVETLRFNNRELGKTSVFYTVSHSLPVFCCDTEKH